VVRGLAVNRFQTGIQLGETNNVVAGNFIGTDPSGTTARGNAVDGILVGNFGLSVPNDGDTIGGSAPADRNLLSGNGRNGVTVSADGFSILGNTISGNTQNGIRIQGANHAIISGNSVGHGADRTTPVASGPKPRRPTSRP
jgi:parallel beta-helix repeat protein